LAGLTTNGTKEEPRQGTAQNDDDVLLDWKIVICKQKEKYDFDKCSVEDGKGF
jgi:hypothetical protein